MFDNLHSIDTRNGAKVEVIALKSPERSMTCSVTLARETNYWKMGPFK